MYMYMYMFIYMYTHHCVLQLDQQAVLAEWEKEQYEIAMQWNWQNFTDEQTRR